MPERFHIQTAATPGRFHRIGKFGGVDWREDCSRCSNCVKRRCCFDVYEHETAHNRDPRSAIETLYECKACFSCVQGCTKGLLSLSANPEFFEMGDDYWRPDAILSTWNQADTGRIPVSGAGYRGEFHGFGFDSIWTDMSEIVRPTRDGIHGREYISTSVDLGRKPMRLHFTPEGEMTGAVAHIFELQLPVILDEPAWLDAPAWQACRQGLASARATAAARLGTFACMDASDAANLPSELRSFAIPVLKGSWGPEERATVGSLGAIVELIDGPDVIEIANQIRSSNPDALILIRHTLDARSADRVVELAAQGFRVFHLVADQHGCERADDSSAGRHIRHIKDVLRDIHGRLVDQGIRDEATLIVTGGIALAEHMAKAIICGADLVGVDTALLVALGCRVCRQAHELHDHRACPVELGSVDVAYAAQRMINLMGAWHNQLIEVLGAMGIREVRRLRGETGRAIFREQIETEAFGDLSRAPLTQATLKGRPQLDWRGQGS